jgi:anti-sigma factor RsiW
MNVTRDVIVDLLPIYLEGEASADTRALVEDFLARDPELARLAATRAEDLLSVEVPANPTPEDEMRALDKAKKLLRWKGSLVGAAVFFSLLPLSIYNLDDGAGVRMLWSSHPAAAGAALAVAGALWIAVLTLRHRLRTTGL